MSLPTAPTAPGGPVPAGGQLEELVPAVAAGEQVGRPVRPAAAGGLDRSEPLARDAHVAAGREQAPGGRLGAAPSGPPPIASQTAHTSLVCSSVSDAIGLSARQAASSSAAAQRGRAHRVRLSVVSG
jgi:hypothetical protein